MIAQNLSSSDWTVRFSVLELLFSMAHWRALEVDCTHAGQLARVWYHTKREARETSIPVNLGVGAMWNVGKENFSL